MSEVDDTQQLEIRVLRAHLRVPIIFLLPLFVLVSVYAGLYLGVNADWTRRQVPQLLQSVLGAGEFKTSELVVYPDLTTVDVYGAEIRETDQTRPTIQADYARASIRPVYLLNGRILFDESHAVRGKVRLEMDESGEMNLLQALGISQQPDDPEISNEEGIAVEFPNLSAESCAFQYVQSGFDFTVPDVDVPGASLEVTGAGNLWIDVPELTVPETNFRFRAELLRLAEAGWEDWRFTAHDTQVTNWRWRDDGFTVDRVQTFADGASIDAAGSMSFPATGTVEDEQSGQPHMTYSGRASVQVNPRAPILQYFLQESVYPDVRDLTVAAEGTLQQIEAGAKLTADRLDASGVQMTDLEANLHLRNQYLSLSDGSMTMYGGEVSVPEAYFDIYRVMYGGRADFKGLDPASLVGDFGLDVDPFRGSLSGAGTIHGAVPFYDKVSLEDELPLLTFANRELVDAEVTETWRFRPAPTSGWPAEGAQIRPGARCFVDFNRVALDNVRMDLPGGQMRIHQAEIDYQNLMFASPTRSPPVLLTANLADPVPLTEGLLGVPIGGVASLKASLRGPIATPSGDFVASIDEPSAPVRGERVRGASADIDVRLQEGKLEVKEGRFDSELGSVRVDGHAELYEKVDTIIGEVWRAKARQPLDLSMKISALDMGAINSLFQLGWGASGFLDASMALGGTVQKPRAEGALEMGTGTVMDATVAGASVGFSVDGEHFGIDHASLGIGGGRVSGSGAYRWEQSAYRLDLGIRGVQLGAIAPLAKYAGRFAPAGRLDASVSGEGQLDDPSLGGTVTVKEAKVGGWPLGDTALTVYGGEESIHVAGAAVSLATLSLEVPVIEQGPIHANLGLKNLELGERFPEIQRLDAVERFGVSGSVDIYAARDLSTYNVVTRFDRMAVQTPARTFRNRGPLVMALNHRGVVQFEEFELGAGGEFINVRGGVRIDPLLLDLRLQGELDLRLLDVVGPYLIGEAYTQSVGRVEGRATVDAGFRGVPTRPIADGSISFSETSIDLRDSPEPVVIHGGRIRLSRQEIQIVEEAPIRGDILGGAFRVTGEMGLDRFRPTSARLNVWSHNLQYRLEDTANVTFDTDVSLTAEDVFKPRTYKVSGSVDVLDGRYYRDMSLVNQRITGRVLEAFRGKTERYQANPLAQMPWLRQVAFDLQIRARDGLLIQNRVDRFQLDLELRVDVRLQQTLNDPRVTGEVKVIDGAVGFQGERFEVTQGSMTYRGSVQKPLIDLRAGADIENRCVDTRQVDTLTSSLSFAGDFDRERQSTYHILLNAEGPLDNMDIELESNPYADQRDILSLMLTGCTVDELTASSASQPTLEIALGPLLGRIEKQVKDVVELSEFSIMPGVERTEVRIGDEVTRRLQWNFQLDTGMSERAGGQRYQLEYRLSERWSAEFSERSLNESDDLLLDIRLKYRVPLGE